MSLIAASWRKGRLCWCDLYGTIAVPLRRCCHAEAGGAGRAACWRARRRGGELRVHRPLSGGGARALRRAQAGTALRQRCCARSL